jgi:hypothetical protein
MWYRLAQNVDRAIETLKSKGVSDETIAQLQAMTDIALRGKYIGALMQNPLMVWNELEEKLSPKKTNILSVQEMRLLSELDSLLNYTNLPEDQKANFYKWVDRVAIPSYRPNQYDSENYSYPKFSDQLSPLNGVQQEINHIFDWYTEYIEDNPRFNIFSMSLDQALQASNEWHEELANQTSTSRFTKIKKENGKIADPNVVMIFDAEILENINLPDKYINWMIVRLTAESDFDLEAEIMGHCLGNERWFEQYKNGVIEIYSLRDESNQPHVTINIELPDTVEQIQGKGNKKPKEDYLKLVQQWIYKYNYFAKNKSYEQDFYLRRGGSESSALESFEEYLNPYIDEDATNDYGVPIRANSPDSQEFIENFDIDYVIDTIGNVTSSYYNDPEFYKSTKEIQDGDDFEKLVEYIGDMFLNYDVNLLREYANEYYPLGMNIKKIKNKLKIEKIKESLIDYIGLELEVITESQSRKFREQEYGPAQTADFYNKTPEAVNEIALSPYQKQPTRGRAKVDENGNDIWKEYDGIYDVYPVFFTDSLYEYMLKNLSSEFYSLANKIGLNLDLSPVTPGSVNEIYNNQKRIYIGRNPQLTLFSTDPSLPDEQQNWIYAYNHKKFRLASVQDEGISDFGYKDLIKPSNDIDVEEIIENIKNYYISQVMKQFVSETPDYDNEYYANMTEELHLMWEEYLDDIRKGDISSLKNVLQIAIDYDLTLPENSIEHEKLSEMLTSGEIAVALKRNS